jgi:hypothetical protein
MKKIITFSVSKNCNYSIRFHSQINNIVTFSIKEDEHFGTYIIKFRNQLQTFNYFNGSSTNLTIVCDTLFYTKIKLVQKNIQIKQIYIAEHLRKGFSKEFYEVLALKDYYNDYLPAIYYGMLSQNDLEVLKKNKSLKIIIWTGGDINYNIMQTDKGSKILINKINHIKNLTKVKHISISPFISKSLLGLGLNYKEVPFIAIDFNMFNPVPKGKSIYIYTSSGEGTYYGSMLYDKIIEKYKDINFIMTCWVNDIKDLQKRKYRNKYMLQHYDKKELAKKIYPQCFIGLRLTSHDGLSATVQELGLMGIKCVHNGSSPSSLNYNSFEDICRHIDNERKTVGTFDVELADKVKDYLTINPNFFTTNFFGD